MIPRDANTINKICSMPRDNVDYRGYWMIIEENYISIAKQKLGEPAEVCISIPKSTFNRFIDWYNTGEWPQKKQGKHDGKT